MTRCGCGPEECSTSCTQRLSMVGVIKSASGAGSPELHRQNTTCSSKARPLDSTLQGTKPHFAHENSFSRIGMTKKRRWKSYIGNSRRSEKMDVSDEHSSFSIVTSSALVADHESGFGRKPGIHRVGFSSKKGKTEFRVAKKRRSYTVLESAACDEKNSARGLHSDGNVELRAVRLFTANVQNASSS